MTDPDKPLEQMVALVPPHRGGPDPLVRALRDLGAGVTRFPDLQPRFPPSWASLDRALGRRGEYTWIVFSGAHAVHNWLARAAEDGIEPTLPPEVRIASIGPGAARALGVEGRAPDAAPESHVASAVVRSLGSLDGARVLLVRAHDASMALPRTLRHAGAQVDTADGFSVAIETPGRTGTVLKRGGLDLLALSHPCAVRYLQRGAEAVGLDLVVLAATPAIAAAGPVTAHAAASIGLDATVVARGSVDGLVEAIVDDWLERPMTRRDLGEQGADFLIRHAAAGTAECGAMVDEGLALAGRLKNEAIGLGMSRATEFSPKIRRYEELAQQILALVRVAPSAHR